MTTREMQALIGRIGHVRYNSSMMEVEVTVTDSKQAYGNTRVRIEPLTGSGHVWVDLNTVTLYPATA